MRLIFSLCLTASGGAADLVPVDSRRGERQVNLSAAATRIVNAEWPLWRERHEAPATTAPP